MFIAEECLTGTDRVAKAYKQLANHDTIINVQGDEPLVKPEDILKVADMREFIDYPSCGMSKIYSKDEFNDPNIVKVVTNIYGNLLYASRAGIPTNKKLEYKGGAHKQVCIYAFSDFDLNAFGFAKDGKTPIEKIEDIELLRALEFNRKVQMVEVSASSIAVNTPEDIKKVEDAILRNG